MAILYPVSPKARTALEKPPRIGEGRHQWLFRVASALQFSGWKPEKIEQFLRDGCTRSGWEDRGGRTIDDILVKLGTDPMLGDSADRRPEWPAPNHDARRARFAHAALFDGEGPGIAETQDVLPRLFGPDELVCIGWSEYRYSNSVLSPELLEQARVAPFVVANPMVAAQDANGSKRNLRIASTPESRRYAVVEFDTHESRQEQTAVLSSLHHDRHPLVLAVWSGGKSIHGWYDVSGLVPYLKLQFFRFIAWLGADKSLWDMCKLVRMPGGSRSGVRQDILYWRPST